MGGILKKCGQVTRTVATLSHRQGDRERCACSRGGFAAESDLVVLRGKRGQKLTFAVVLISANEAASR